MERKPLRAEENKEITMEEYRYKEYWDNGNVTFDTITSNERIALESARETTRYYMTIKKVDVYKGTKLIATFYK